MKWKGNVDVLLMAFPITKDVKEFMAKVNVTDNF